MSKRYSCIIKTLLLIVMVGLKTFDGFSNVLQYNMKKDSVNLIIKKLEKKHNVSITYGVEIVDKIIISSEEVILKQETIEKALDILVKGSNVYYKKMRDDFYILVIEKEEESEFDNSKLSLFEGTVFDDQNLPLTGATIWVKNTTIGTSSDLDGNFSLSYTKKSVVLTISFIGYKPIDIEATAGTPVVVNLQEDFFGIDEVVVSGVADNTPVKKLTVTVAKVNADKLNEAPAASAASSLQGKVAGVQIISANGTPGNETAIRLRGSTSLVGNQAPLILVDGNILESSLADINVDDIESMEVVKGAAAASLYGSKAGSGVILVTTKRGKNLDEGAYEITFRKEYGFSSLTNQIELAEHHPYQLDDDYANYTTFTKYDGVKYDEDGNLLRGSRSLNDNHYADQPYGLINDNQSTFFNPGNYSTNYVSVANRSKKSNIFLSYENSMQEGILFSTDGYTRNNFRVNVDYSISDKLKISTSNLIIDTKSDNPGSNSAFFDLLFLSPDVNLETPNEDGSPYNIKPDPWSLEENPLYPLYYRKRTAMRNSILSNIIGSYKPFSWLSFKAKYTYEKLNKHWTTYTPRGYLYGGGASIEGKVYKEQYTSTFQTFQYTMNINKTVNNFTVKSKISYLLEDKQYNDFWITGSDLIANEIPQLNNTEPEKATMESYEGIIRSENIFGIIDFDYKSKYLFSGLFRMDGSSLFGEEERWHPYYRFSAAYRISEDFNIPGLNELKVRAAYGIAGQRPGFSNQYETMYIEDGEFVRSTIGNKYLKPSKSEETEFALDAEILNRITFNVSYSMTNTSDAIMRAAISPHLDGFPEQWKNVGTISSNSLESTMGYVAIDKKDIFLQLNLVYDKVVQKITELNVPEYKTGPNNAFLIKEGETLGIIYGYKWLTSLDEMEKQLPAGNTIDNYMVNSDGYVIEKGTEGTINESPILYDKDGNGIADLTKIGDGNADFHMSFNMTFRWKALSLYTLWDWKQGGDIYNYTHQYTFRDNRAVEIDQYGKAENEKKTIDYYSNFYYHTAVNSYFIEDGSYLKLRELSLYYTLKKESLKFLNKVHISSIRLGLVGRNLYTFTKYSGYDPEVASGSDLSNFPFDNFGYPNYRTITGSIVVKFN